MRTGRFQVRCWNGDHLRWAIAFSNLWTTEGKNADLDDFIGGAGVNLYLGLISSVGWTTVAAGDTAAQINGSNAWKEAGLANAPTYSQAARPAATLSAASGGARVTTSAAQFSITSNGTVKGCFTVTSSVKDGTGGKLITAGLFAGGDQIVTTGDRVDASWTGSL